MTQRITVVGDGGMGTVCALMLCENGADVTVWSAFEDQAAAIQRDRVNAKFLPGVQLPSNLTATADVAQAARADLLISAVPTEYLRSVWARFADVLDSDTPICSVTKGIENHTLLRPTEMLAELVGEQRSYAALSGPNIAPEIARQLPATAVVASCDASLAQRVQDAISRPYFRVYTNPDRVGVELAGAMKNVIAIAAGIVDGLGLGSNAKAALITRGLVEIARLGVAAGAQQETFAGLAGLGDLVTTCISSEGRNRSFGQAIGQGGNPDDVLASMTMVVEGVATTRSVIELAQRKNISMPLSQGVHDILFSQKSPREAITELMTRPLRGE
jgi:glycerol-3-phosphate dehydrogenase (NAD(P)+)